MLALIFVGQTDSTAPVLSLPTGTATSDTTATGTVSTDEAGTLYYYASVNSSESAATIKASGESQAATTGVQNVAVIGLTAKTEYYLHYVEDDGASNESNVVSSSAFTTDASGTGGFLWVQFEAEQRRREKERKDREKAKREAQKIEDELHRQLALENRKLEEETARKAELARLNRLVANHQNVIESFGIERLTFVMNEALAEQTFSKMERLERELTLIREEELFLIEATFILVDQ